LNEEAPGLAALGLLHMKALSLVFVVRRAPMALFLQNLMLASGLPAALLFTDLSETQVHDSPNFYVP
jgi:hypothetical protein